MSGKSELRRIFIAIDLSEEARSVCAAHVESLRRGFPWARVGWERPEKLHITLKFLGPTTEDTLAELLKKLEQVSSLQPELLRLGVPGVFPNKNRPRILWVGVDDRETFAARANALVEDVCGSLGFETDDRRFTPHITIGRVRDPNSARDLVAAHLDAQIEPVEFEADSLAVYESKLLPTGSVYSVVARFSGAVSR